MIPQEALDLILDSEGLNQPSKWPGGDSGITLGYGYDLGYTTAADFTRDWGAHLTLDQVQRLSPACSLRGSAAQAAAPRYANIIVTAGAARAVFVGCSLPKYESLTRNAFGPGFERLPADAQGALVSLVYNRGTDMEGDRRTEMRAIRTACDTLSAAPAGGPPFTAAQRAACVEIAAQLRSMKRLWAGTSLQGLVARREAEAQLVERGMPA